MLLTEFNQDLYERTIRQESEEKGRKEERNRLNGFYLSLIQEGRMDDLKHAIRDNNFREQLIQSNNL